MKNTFVRFLLVGSFNTITNIILLNIFVFSFGITPLLANFLATSISLCISFILTSRFVFSIRHHSRPSRTFGLFVVSNMFSQIIVQQAVLWLSLQLLRDPVSQTYDLFDRYQIVNEFSETVYLLNLAKGFAIVASAITTYYLYRNLVFPLNEEVKEEEE